MSAGEEGMRGLCLTASPLEDDQLAFTASLKVYDEYGSGMQDCIHLLPGEMKQQVPCLADLRN